MTLSVKHAANPEELKNLSPAQLAGFLDRAVLAVADSEGPALGPQTTAEIADHSGQASLSERAQIVTVAGDETSPRRRRLPNRRPGLTVTVTHNAVPYTVDFGTDPATVSLSEIFIEAPPSAPVDHQLLHDVAALISLTLQSGISPGSLMQIVGLRSGDYGAGFSSVVGAALFEAVKIEREPKLL